MHWFWRAAIAVLTGMGLGYVLCLTLLRAMPLGAPATDWRFRSLTVIIPLTVPLASSIMSLMAYGMATLLFGPRAVQKRRRKKGLCLTCGYDLQGNVSGVCPECGEKI
jgi:hypothetical protein